jgi:phage-related protein
MAVRDEWTIVTYDEAGTNPVGKFIESLDAKTQGRLAWSVEQLRVRNVLAREPLVRHIEGKIWELRDGSETNIYRVFYFAAVGRRFVLLHAFQKKTQKTPRREIATAQRRLEDFERTDRSKK